MRLFPSPFALLSSPRLVPAVMVFLGLPTLAIELALLGADLHLWGAPLWRAKAFFLGAFHPLLLAGGPGLWPGQVAGMFVTHVFFHVGPWHMATNMLVLAMLTRMLQGRMRLLVFLGLYFMSAIGGAVIYALITPGITPMTGASGALSGLAAAWAVRQGMDRKRSGIRQALALIAGLAIAEILLGALLNQRMAWQAHFGGGLTGAALATLLFPAARKYRRLHARQHRRDKEEWQDLP